MIIIRMLGLVISLIIMTGFIETGYFKNKKGNNLFDKGDYDEAMKNYRDAQIITPDSPVLYYNIGNTYYRKGDYDKSIAEYRKALNASNNDDFKAKVLYNMGNSNLMAALKYNDTEKNDPAVARLKSAITSYEDALRISPNDNDIKFNLEVAKKKLEEIMKEIDNKSQSNNEDKYKDKNTDKKGDNQNSRDNKDNNSSRGSEGGDKGKDKENQKTDRGGENKIDNMKDKNKEKDKGEEDSQIGLKEETISKEEAEKILSTIEDENKMKDILMNRHEKFTERDVLEDW